MSELERIRERLAGLQRDVELEHVRHKRLSDSAAADWETAYEQGAAAALAGVMVQLDGFAKSVDESIVIGSA
jgi:hypothetical protein